MLNSVLQLVPTGMAANLRKRRGVVRASITRLVKRLEDLETAPDRPDVSSSAKQLAVKLEVLDTEYKALHLQLIDLIDEETEEMDQEQVNLDKHDDSVAVLSVRLQSLVLNSSVSTVASDAGRKASARKLSRLETLLAATDEALGTMPGGGDITFVEQHADQLIDYKKELASIYEELVSLDLDEDDLFFLHARLKKLHFAYSHKVRQLRSSLSTNPLIADGRGVRLPKLEVPTFDGDVLHWKQFWEQFSISGHDRSNLSNAEKLVYLQQAVKNGSAKNTIEGLSRSRDHYPEAVECLMSRFNRPRLIHRAHVRVIMDAPSLKDGSGRELRRLHDTIQQHLRALKSLKCEPSGSFLTSVIELHDDRLLVLKKHNLCLN